MTVAAGQHDHRARAIRPAPGRWAGDRRSAPAGRRGRTARRVQGLRLQPAPVARPAARRPDHPDVPAAVPGDVPDRRLPQPRRHREAGQRGPRPDPERRAGPPPRHGQAAAARRRRRRGRAAHTAHGQPAARAQGAGHAPAGARGERRRSTPAAAVPRTPRRGRRRLRPGRGLLAVRRPWAGRRYPAGPARPGGSARRARLSPWSPPLSTSADTRPAAAMGVRGPAWSASGST